MLPDQVKHGLKLHVRLRYARIQYTMGSPEWKDAVMCAYLKSRGGRRMLAQAMVHPLKQRLTSAP